MDLSEGSRCQWKESTKLTSADCTLEGVRQPETESRRSVPIAMDRRVVPVFSRFIPGLVPVRSTDNRISGLPSHRCGTDDASARDSMDESLLERLGRLSHKHRTGRFGPGCIATSGLSDVRRYRADFISTVHLT